MLTLRQPRGATMTLGPNFTVAMTGANVTYKISTSFTYSIDGKLYIKTTTTTTVPTTDVNTGSAFTALAADQGCVFVWGVNTAGTVQVAQGPVAEINPDTDEFEATPGGPKSAPQFPYIPDTMCPFAYSIHQTAGTSSAWTFGSSNWNATGLKDILVECSSLPVRPPTDTTA